MNAVEVGKEGSRTTRAAALAGTPFGVLGTMAVACAGALAIGAVGFALAASVPVSPTLAMAVYAALMVVAAVLSARRYTARPVVGRAITSGLAAGFVVAALCGAFMLLIVVGLAAEHGH